LATVALGWQTLEEHTEGGTGGEGLGLGVGVGLPLQAEPLPSTRIAGQHWPARAGLSARIVNGSTPGAPSCTESGVSSYTLVGVSKPAPHGVAIRRMRSADTFITSACARRQSALPLQAGAKPSELSLPTSGPGSK
jgi:hypothetical protein